MTILSLFFSRGPVQLPTLLRRSRLALLRVGEKMNLLTCQLLGLFWPEMTRTQTTPQKERLPAQWLSVPYSPSWIHSRCVISAWAGERKREREKEIYNLTLTQGYLKEAESLREQLQEKISEVLNLHNYSEWHHTCLPPPTIIPPTQYTQSSH